MIPQVLNLEVYLVDSAMHTRLKEPLLRNDCIKYYFVYYLFNSWMMPDDIG